MAVEAGGIGGRLRAAREKLGLTVLQVAERIHTDPKIVEALEAENFEALGAPVYARGHIRHYAELVGESSPELIALYADSSKVAQPDLTRIVKAPARSSSNKLVAPALLVLAVFAVAGAVWWVSALSKKKPQLSETHVVGEESQSQAAATGPGSASPVAPSTSTPTPTQTPQQAKPGGAPPGTMAMAMQSRPAAPAGAGAQAGRSSTGSGGAVPTPQSRASAGTSEAGRPAANTSATSASSVAGAPVPVLPHSRNQAQVLLRYSADSWTEVYDASGARLFYDVGAANSVQTVVGTPPLRVVLGNAAGVAVEFNGHNTPIAKLSHPDGSVQFSINSLGRVVRAKPSADGG